MFRSEYLQKHYLQLISVRSETKEKSSGVSYLSVSTIKGRHLPLVSFQSDCFLRLVNILS